MLLKNEINISWNVCGESMLDRLLNYQMHECNKRFAKSRLQHKGIKSFATFCDKKKYILRAFQGLLIY